MAPAPGGPAGPSRPGRSITADVGRPSSAAAPAGGVIHPSSTHPASHALRHNFPDRFGPGKPSFQVLYSVHDLPRTDCLNDPRRCKTEAFAPVLHFGSVPNDPTILPTTQAMPLPPFAECMMRMAMGKKDASDADADDASGVCDLFRIPKSSPAWDDLVPTIVWRGRNFGFLNDFGYGHWMRWMHFYWDVNPSKLSRDEVADALLGDDVYDSLTPRWRGVAHSLRAKVEAEQRDGTTAATPPWIDVKFFHEKLNSDPNDRMAAYVNTGNLVATSEYMDEDELATYRYHIDFGGGGGTTWEGTIRKLAMPGLLFHHEAITKDWFHDEIEAWVHYVPIKMDVSDLKEKYEWAESHPEEARRIARAGQEFVRTRMREFMRESYEDLFVDYLGEVVEAYRPGEGESVESILDGYGAEGIEMELASVMSSNREQSG